MFLDKFPGPTYPSLIGIMRSFERDTNGIITSQYEFQSFIKYDDQGCQIQNLKISSSLRKIRNLSGEFFSKISRKIRKFSFWDLRSK